ncbi:MAG: reverse transcriptase domain-containing protein [Paraclostridium sp.]|uniref:reverse transcriptase domain-containing protein n=1 Tax=Paraclostridium sp. TaxID=2023273 RepID=UPI003F2A2E04
MRDVIYDSIIEEARKNAKRYHMYHNNLEIIYQRNRKRIQNPPVKDVKIPDCWQADKKFNPFYVIKHAKQISKSIKYKLNNDDYKPKDPFIREVAKASGGIRKITVYQIPDAAISNYLYHRLLSKNKHRFSSLSYAYRDDRNVHYAVQDISLELKSHPRLFVAEFDFSDFFGSIEHDYLFKQFDQNGFIINDYERRLIKAFVNVNERGIPQGTSISLFLANLVCWKLDRALEAEGLRFARYADDTVIWSNDYTKICKSFEIITSFSKEIGVHINLKKSEGISLLSSRDMPSEFYKTKEYIDFLGYKLSGNKVSIKNNKIRAIKQEISYLLYRNLIQPIKSKPFIAITIPNNDEDAMFVTAIMQIRRYLYGNLNDKLLELYLSGVYKRLNFKGLMSFYPLIDDEEQLKELDGWLVSTIFNCLKLRSKLLYDAGFDVSHQFPFNVDKSQIIEKCKIQQYKGKKGLMEIPSFTKIYKVVKKGVFDYGIDGVMNPLSNIYNYYH